MFLLVLDLGTPEAIVETHVASFSAIIGCLPERRIDHGWISFILWDFCMQESAVRAILIRVDKLRSIPIDLVGKVAIAEQDSHFVVDFLDLFSN